MQPPANVFEFQEGFLYLTPGDFPAIDLTSLCVPEKRQCPYCPFKTSKRRAMDMHKQRMHPETVKRKPKFDPPKFDDLGLSITAGYVKAEVIRLASEGKDYKQICDELTDWVDMADVERWCKESPERLQFVAGLKGKSKKDYLAGVALAHNQMLVDRRIRP